MNNQKGAIFPLLVIILLIIGIVVGTKLVDIPQIFKSRASVPVTLPTPVFEDDFSINTGWELLGIGMNREWGHNSIGEYLVSEGLMRILITGQDGYKYLQKRINITGEFIAMFDFILRGQNNSLKTGFHFGGPGWPNVYRFYVKNQGGVELKYGMGNESIIFDSQTGVRLVDDKIYKLRVDRRLNELKAWLSEDNGANWESIATISINPNNAVGADGAMYMGFVASAFHVGQNYAEARFDNLKVWRLGQVPEPVDVVVTPTPTPTPGGSLPTLASLNIVPPNGTTISSTDTIAVTAAVNNGDRFDIWVDWKCFAGTTLAGQTNSFTIAQVVDAGRPDTSQCTPDTKAAGSHTVHVAPIRGAGGVAGRSDGAVYTVRP